MINQLDIFGKNKIEKAIQLLRDFEPKEGYYLAFSGGKDSCVIKELANMANVKYDAHYNITTVDPPPLVRFIKTHHPDVIREVPEMNMWDLIVEQGMPPTRRMRFCCKLLKEDGGMGRTVITGIRKAESGRRSKRNEVENHDIEDRRTEVNSQLYKMNDNDSRRKFIESCPTKGKWIVNPIIDWSDADVWEFIKGTEIPYCELYDQGFKRIGCMGCPMGNTKQQERDFKKFPTIKKNYIRAFDRMLARRKEKGLETKWKTGQDVFDWWLYGTKKEEELGELYEGIIDD